MGSGGGRCCPGLPGPPGPPGAPPPGGPSLLSWALTRNADAPSASTVSIVFMFVFILCSLSFFAGVNLYAVNLRERTLRKREVEN
jgi:hypothetical protein